MDWTCGQTIQSDGPIYALCCLNDLIVSAGSGSKISVWRSTHVNPTSIETLNLHTIVRHLILRLQVSYNIYVKIDI